jgi:hypothetical protein
VLLALLHRLIDGAIGARQIARISPRLADIARRKEQSRQHQLLDRVGVRAGRVEYRHAASRQCRHRNVVGAGAGARHRQQRSAIGIACMSAERSSTACGWPISEATSY